MKVFSLIQENFQAQIDHGLTLVCFIKSECETCQNQLYLLEELADEVRHQATLVQVDSEQEGVLASTYSVTNTPTLMLFKDGYQVETLIGFQTKDNLKQTILRYSGIGDTC
ncbi:co-chaperone YbbN [Paenibacillus sp. CF384]|uniref:thioredoxin family protein n=1 Tax=Paenibacillus sp. CF384 TaxID=1884382 RepID=UPI00089CE725|nr:thioredoxin domain-containing protein [Paenibacillus sp. CF384]SDW09985.1 thioredoxin 1 [Paenibacillus sp. CF384]